MTTTESKLPILQTPEDSSGSSDSTKRISKLFNTRLKEKARRKSLNPPGQMQGDRKASTVSKAGSQE